jgi:transcriptional regulator with XRE-family HTH domain
MEEINNTVVAIDGEAIRRIREGKRLTQLYVAKVVGVTTDTVSRWENNRYPSIRRDNAIKLAEALEVEIEQILQSVSEDSDCDLAVGEPDGRRFGIYVALVLLLLCIAAIAWFQFGQTPPEIAAQRILPAYAAPGDKVLIQVHLELDESLMGVILREQLPDGWRLVDAYPAISGYDEKTHVARWIFRAPAQQLKVFYLLEVPEDQSVTEPILVTGDLVANSKKQQVLTDIESIGEMRIKPLHWVDANGNHVIDDIEILDLSILTEETGPLPLGWDAIEELWQAEGYHWDFQQRRFVVGF